MYYGWRDRINEDRTIFCNPDADARWLARQSGDSGLEQALNSLMYPNARCATPGVTHQTVLGILWSIAQNNPRYGLIATNITARYEKMYCPPIA